jgi:hypothetical protein
VANRILTQSERFVLEEVRAYWGTQNTEADVFLTDAGEAALFANSQDGTSQVCVVLTNLGEWYDDGTLSLPDLRAFIAGPERLA